METRLLCAIPPPCRQPKRDPFALMTMCEQWSAKHYDQVTEPAERAEVFTYLKRTPFEQSAYKKLLNFANSQQLKLQEHEAAMKTLLEKDPKMADLFEDNIITSIVGDVNPAQMIYRESSECRLGSGAFGAVYKGEMLLSEKELYLPVDKQKKLPAAIKVQEMEYTKEDFRPVWVNELEILANLYHPNVIRLLGYCKNNEGKILMACELMMSGLDKFLTNLRKDERSLTINEQVDFIQQMSRGAAYLHALTPAVVHGDMALRNVFISPHPIDLSRYRLKITDFGLSKLTPHELPIAYTDPNKIPFKWCPRETLAKRQMSPKGYDIWMFGVTICELYGVTEPYGVMEPGKIGPMIKGGKRMEKPEEMPCFIYELVMKCWRKQPIDRLNFCEIADLLEPFYIESEFVHVEALLERNEETKRKLARKSSRMRL